MFKKLITRIKKLDKQHEKLILTVKNLKDCIEKQSPREQIIELIESLDFYANEHFLYEEILAEKCQFYRKEELKEAHNDFRNHYFLIKRFYEPNKNLTPKIYALLLVNVLEGWLNFHLEYIEYEFLKELRKCLRKGLDISDI
jgi:hemerythrin-like metal-binding protein